MNNNLLLIVNLLFLAISFANGQDFDQLYSENIFNSVVYSESLSNGKIILQTEHNNGYYSLGGGADPEYIHFVNEFSDSIYNFNKLYLFNEELSIEKEVIFQSTLDSINWVLNFQADEADDALVVLVANLMADTTKFYMHWYNLDLELQHTLPLPARFKAIAHRFFGWHFIINKNNNVVYAGTDGFHEFDRYGKTINTYYFTGQEVYGPPPPYIYQNSLGEYFSTNPQLREYVSFREDLSLIEGISYIFLQERVNRDCRRLALDTKKEIAYNTGFLRVRELDCDIADFSIFRYAEFVYKYDLLNPGPPTVFFTDTLQKCNGTRYGQFAIDLHYDDYIYYSHSDKDCGFIAPPGAEPTCYETYITLKCLDDEGNLRWKKYLGGDAAYLPQGVVATPDSGVVVFALRHHPDENLRYAADIYAAKFDKNGNPVDLSNAGLVSVNEFELNSNIKIYPNPVTDYVVVEGLNPSYQNTIKLYNSAGQLVLQQTINNSKLSLKQLTKGYYTYAIFEEEGLQKASKLLKW